MTRPSLRAWRGAATRAWSAGQRLHRMQVPVRTAANNSSHAAGAGSSMPRAALPSQTIIKERAPSV